MRRRIRALCSAADPDPDLDEALCLLDCIRLHLSGYCPDLAAILRALSSLGRFVEAHRRFLLHFRHASSPSPFPSTPTASSSRCALGSSYTTLLDSYARLGDGDATCHLLDEMPSTGVAPNSFTRTVLIKVGHVDSGKSTLSGRLLHLLGRISKKEMHKNEKEAKEKNRIRNPTTASGYPSRLPRAPTNWGPPGAPPMRQPVYAYMQTGAHHTQTPQYNLHQPPYASYPPQVPGNFQPGWDQSSNQQTQQPTAATGYEYYNQQQLQQQTQLQPMVGSSAPADNASYNYAQPQGPQQAVYGTAPSYGPISNPSLDRSAPSQDGMNQVTPAHQQAHLVGPANQQGYAGQVTPVTANGYGIPPTPQPNYGSQPAPQAGYGQPSQVTQLGYSQPLQLQAGYDQGSTDRAPPFQPTAPQSSYGPQQVYGGVGPMAQPSYGLQQQPYGDSYVSGGYSQPPAYSSDNATHGILDQSAAAPAVPGGAAKASPS